MTPTTVIPGIWDKSAVGVRLSLNTSPVGWRKAEKVGVSSDHPALLTPDLSVLLLFYFSLMYTLWETRSVR